jgi:hypothetical protein
MPAGIPLAAGFRMMAWLVPSASAVALVPTSTRAYAELPDNVSVFVAS